MTQYNMLEAKTNFSKIIKSLENKKEDEVIIARDGEPIAVITLYRKPKTKKVGCAKKAFPKIDFEKLEEYEDEIIGMFDKDKGLFK